MRPLRIIVMAEHLEVREADEVLAGVSGILVPGGFGDRGISGKIKAAQYARENDIPYLGGFKQNYLPLRA